MRRALVMIMIAMLASAGPGPVAAQQQRANTAATGWAMPPADFGFNFNQVSFGIGAQTLAANVDECVLGPAARVCEMAFGPVLGGSVVTTTDAARLTEVNVMLGRGAARGRSTDPVRELTLTITVLAALLEPGSTERERANLVQALLAGAPATDQPRRARIGGTTFEASLAPAMALFVVARPAR